MADIAVTVPLATATSAVFAAGALWFQVRSIAKTLGKLSERVEKLADDKMGEMNARIARLEVWQSGHEQQSTERWREIQDREHKR